eukprot:CAMPEP_0119109738 /NCGR_PEP_ID=MMETSP1180-20130426/22829_1 /TAXON_ID=3052 ORGANISM="Chlamydomonas cf sp, Strain CCMP681" /NCGR_SAMPLE_ID=MMETSP1180 /ASSEMBLY_ACC=CAM_ASM_000741 /LENGTH=70 /DNA_ID=CAMNT_0007095671 /DNA_START=827 /DNA_END=1039 /DNA_ORIENTATION=-
MKVSIENLEVIYGLQLLCSWLGRKLGTCVVEEEVGRKWLRRKWGGKGSNGMHHGWRWQFAESRMIMQPVD